MIRQWLQQKLGVHYPGTSFEVSVPPDSKLGDYSVNLAFTLAKSQGRPPMEAAQEIANHFAKSEVFERVQAIAPGFVNFFVSKNFLQNELPKLYTERQNYGRENIGKGRTVIVEYPSTNVAKPMHVGHSRPAFIGDSLARIYDFIGYRVVRWDHLGDWGTQFGMIISAYKMWGDKKIIEAKPLEALNDLYVRFRVEMKDHPDYETKAREEFKKLEDGDRENKELWEWFRQESLKESKKVYNQLGLLPSHKEVGESFYLPRLKEIVDNLLSRGIAKQSEGAIIIELEKLPPALIQKSDGASLYLTRDIASLLYRVDRERPEKVLYVVGNEQALHLEQLFSIGRLLGVKTDLQHVKYGLILGENGKKLSTREGNAVLLRDVIDKATALSLQIAKEKNKEISAHDADAIAQVIGIGALKYNDLKQHPHSDIVFDWQSMLDLSGNSGPYLQYTYARLMSIIRKSGWRWLRRPDFSTLDHELEAPLIKYILDFPEAVVRSAQLHAANGLALYLYELTAKASRYYETVYILDDKNSRRKEARLILIETVATILKRGLNLLGIETLERI